MGLRVLERLMYMSLLLYLILMPVGYCKNIPVMFGAGIAMGVMSMILWIEVMKIEERQKEMDGKYGKRSRRDY